MKIEQVLCDSRVGDEESTIVRVYLGVEEVGDNKVNFED